MAEATRLSVMSKQIEDNKQATYDIRAQMADLMKHQADLSKSIEAMLSKLVSPSSGQTSRASGLNASPSGCLTTTPLLPDPPDTIRYGKELVGNGEAEAGIPKGLSTRLTKVGFPSFDGTKLRNWVHRCEQFFMLDGTPPEMKVRLASIYLDGEAFEWHRNYINSRYGVYPLWPDYVADLTGRFGEDIDDPLSVLIKVKQDGDSVEKYLARFESALTMVSLPATHSLSIFMANMNPRLALHARQFAARTVSEAARFAKLHESYLHFSPLKQDRAPFSPYQNQNNQFHYNNPNTTSSLTPLETTKTLPYKPNIPTETDMEKSPKKLYCEEIQESGMRGLCMSSDGSYASGHHLGSKKSQVFVVECDDEESFGVREPSEVAVEEIVDKSVDMIQEEKSTPENESRPEVSPHILLSQFQVSLSSLEPGRRYQKESLVVVNDLSSNLGCVIGKTIGCKCDYEIGQVNSLDEEEFNRVWEPGGVFIEHDKWQGSEKCHELSIVVRLMQGLSSTRWSYGKVAELTQELQQPKTYLKEIKLKELERSVTCSSVGCIVALLMVYDAKRIQSDAPPIFSDLLCVKNRIQGRLKMVLLLEFLWLILVTSKMFKSSNVPQNKNQTDQKLSSYWKLLLSWKISQNIHVSSRCVLRQKESYVKVLELIKDKDSKKRKLHKNWWFKYKLNTWLSGALHHTGFVKIIQTFSPMINDTHWDKETWVKLNPESCKGGSLLEFLKRHEARFDMIKVPNNTKFFNHLKFLVESYILRIGDALKGCKFVNFKMKQSEKPLITILSYEVYHSPRPPELSQCKEDEEYTATESVSAIVGDNEAKAQKFSSLRTRMFSTGEYCNRIIWLSPNPLPHLLICNKPVCPGG